MNELLKENKPAQPIKSINLDRLGQYCRYITKQDGETGGCREMSDCSILLKYLFIYIWLCQISVVALRIFMQHEGSVVAGCGFLFLACGIQFPEKNMNRAPHTGSMETQPLDCQGSPQIALFLKYFQQDFKNQLLNFIIIFSWMSRHRISSPLVLICKEPWI